MSNYELHQWADDQQLSPDRLLREVAAAVRVLLKERPELLTVEYEELRTALKRAEADRASYARELSRLRALLSSAAPAENLSGVPDGTDG